MGLEIVGLILGVEEAFDIEVPDEDAERWATAGDLHAYVCRRLGLGPRPLNVDRAPRCASQVAFHRLRRQLCEGHGVLRRSVAPAAPLDALLSPRREERRAQWDALRSSLGASLPDLEPAAFWRGTIWAAVLAPLAAGVCLWVLAGADHPALRLTAFTLFVFAPVMGNAAMRAARATASRIPAPCATVGGTVRALLAGGFGALVPERPVTRPGATGEWTADAVWHTLVGVIVEQLGVTSEEVTPAAHLVDDLAMG